MRTLNINENAGLDAVELQARLNAIPGSKGNSFSNDTWHFYSPSGAESTLDFQEIKFLSENFPDWCAKLNFDLVMISKVMWLDASSNALSTYQARLKGIILFWVALAKIRSYQLNQDNAMQVVEIFLLQNFEKNDLIRRINIYSHIQFQRLFRLEEWKHTFRVLGMHNLIENVKGSSIKKNLRELIPTLTNDELTYADWMAGGTLNNLTLDYGQYYIEHCMKFFGENIAFATAISATYASVDHFCQTIQRERSTVLQWTTEILNGRSTEDIVGFSDSSNGRTSSRTIESLRDLVVQQFQKVYSDESFLTLILSEAGIIPLLELLNINTSQANYDRMSAITWNWMSTQNRDETSQLLAQTDSSLTLEKFLAVLDILRLKHNSTTFNMPTIEDYHSLGIFEPVRLNSHNKPARKLARLVEAAGLTSLVALTGWRQSEFGFSISDLKKMLNADLLDQHAFPFRYQIHWFVFKTGGDIRQWREITFYTNVLIERMQRLTVADANHPCLYRTNSQRSNLQDSTASVSRAVTLLWTHYAHNYEPFKMIEELERWHQIAAMKSNNETLSSIDLKDFNRLIALRTIEEWQSLDISGDLREAYRICRQQLPLLQFFLADAASVDKMNWLVRYKNQTLRPDWIELIDNILSDETKSWIASLDESACKQVGIVKPIISELIADYLYPSPHAFRHIWVEAVYRRRDGDIGWIVRSHFKHITRSQWLAYVRNKDNRAIHRAAKEEVISSLVHNYLDKRGQGYTGNLHVWLRRILNKTHVLTSNEQKDFFDRIATVEIVDVRSNPWGYCLLKRRTQAKAKCAAFGIPEQHNAAPDLCLSCIHNLMQPEHVDWLVFSAAPHVESLKSPGVPNIFRDASIEFVSSVMKQVKSLDPNHQAIPELSQALNACSLERTHQ
ncbi:MAG TPA: hypothetical protein DIW64_14220 [Cellvibrio sp.]|nr:hypothetical protein [Cellvibrio sp.]